MKFLHKDTLCEILRFLANFDQVENLGDALEPFHNTRKRNTCFWPFFLFSMYYKYNLKLWAKGRGNGHTWSNDVSFLWVVVKRARDASFSRFLVSSTAPSLNIEPYVSWISWNLSLSSSAILVNSWIRRLMMIPLSCLRKRFDWSVSRDTFRGRSSASAVC